MRSVTATTLSSHKKLGLVWAVLAFATVIVVSGVSSTVVHAVPTPSPSCAAGVGRGGNKDPDITKTRGGNGCVVVQYTVNGAKVHETYNYTGADQTWTVPSGITSATFFLIGAGGGGSESDYNASYTGGVGGAGGYATGTYAVTPGAQMTVIVGGAGGGVNSVDVGVGNTSEKRKMQMSSTYGGGGKAVSVESWASGYAAGGGRSAIRLANGTEIATAGGGGGAGSTSSSVSTSANGAAGGGTSGSSVGTYGGSGGTQIAGGAAGMNGWGVAVYNATAGAQFVGGESNDESGGGGGGWYGGGGGGDPAYSNLSLAGGWGGGGGSSYIAALSSASTEAGSGQNIGVTIPSQPVTSGLSCVENIATITIGQSSNGGTTVMNYEYSIVTGATKPTSQPTVWTPFDPTKIGPTVSWDLKTMGYAKDQTFRFYVRAVNMVGASLGSWSAASDDSCVATWPTPPEPPTSLVVTAGVGSASIAFTPGSSNGAPIANYEYSLDGINFTALNPADASSPVQISGFVPGVVQQIYLRAVNSAGTSVASSPVTVTSLPFPSTITSVSPSSGATTGGTAITLTGTNLSLVNNITVGGSSCSNVTVISATSVSCTTTAGVSGVADITVSTSTNQSATLPNGYTYVGSPSVPDLLDSSDTGVSNTDNTTADNTPTIGVPNIANGTIVTITASKSGSASVSCTYAATAQTSCDLGTLSDGSWSVSGTTTLPGGATSTVSASLPLVIDTTADVPAEPDLLDSSDTGVSNTDNSTSDNTPTIGVPNVANGTTVTITASKSGSASVSCTYAATAQTSCDLGTLSDGSWSVSASTVDVAGNVSIGGATLSLQIDLLPPPAPTALLNSGNATGDPRPTIRTNVETPGSTVTGSATNGTRTVSCSYVGSTTTTGCALPTLTPGMWSVSATVTDLAGNMSMPSSAIDIKILKIDLPANSVSLRIIPNGSQGITATATLKKSEIGKVSKVVFRILSADGTAKKTIRMSPTVNSTTVSMSFQQLSKGQRISVHVENWLGVSANSPRNANVLRGATTKKFDSNGNPILPGKTVLVSRIIFNPASSKLDNNDRRILAVIASHIRNRGGIVMVSGFARQNLTDTKAFLNQLSDDRARAVSEFLSARGVRAWIRYQGYGTPTMHPGTWEDRRVEIRWAEGSSDVPKK